MVLAGLSTTAAVEGINFIHTNQLVKLSEQQLIDCCDLTYQGCDGGSPYKAFEYIIVNGGQVPYASYPYQGCQNQVIRPTKVCPKISHYSLDNIVPHLTN